MSARTAIVARSNERSSRWSGDSPANAGSSRPPSAWVGRDDRRLRGGAGDCLGHLGSSDDRSCEEEGATKLFVGPHCHREEPACDRDLPSRQEKPRLSDPRLALDRHRGQPPPFGAGDAVLDRGELGRIARRPLDRSYARGDPAARTRPRRPVGRRSRCGSSRACTALRSSGSRRASVLSLRSRAIETPPRRATDRRHRQTTRPPCPLGSDDPRRERQTEWKGSAARTACSDHPNAGRRRPTVPPRGRMCEQIGCETILSTYNASPVCWLHAPPAYRHALSRD